MTVLRGCDGLYGGGWRMINPRRRLYPFGIPVTPHIVETTDLGQGSSIAFGDVTSSALAEFAFGRGAGQALAGGNRREFVMRWLADESPKQRRTIRVCGFGQKAYDRTQRAICEADQLRAVGRG